MVTFSEDIVTFSGDIVTLFEARVTLSEDGLIVVKLIFHLPRPTSDCQSQQKYQKYLYGNAAYHIYGLFKCSPQSRDADIAQSPPIPKDSLFDD